MKTQHYVILAIAALAVYFLFFRTEDVILDETDSPKAGTDRPEQGKSVPQARVVVPGKKRPITVGGLPATGRWYGYGPNGRQAANDASRNTGCTFVENYGEYGCF